MMDTTDTPQVPVSTAFIQHPFVRIVELTRDTPNSLRVRRRQIVKTCVARENVRCTDYLHESKRGHIASE